MQTVSGCAPCQHKPRQAEEWVYLRVAHRVGSVTGGRTRAWRAGPERVNVHVETLVEHFDADATPEDGEQVTDRPQPWAESDQS